MARQRPEVLADQVLADLILLKDVPPPDGYPPPEDLACLAFFSGEASSRQATTRC